MSGKTFACAAAALALAIAGQASAAAGVRIAELSGQAIVITGKGAAETAKAGRALARGDRMIVKSGQAKLLYGDGCSVAVKAGAMATVAAASPCASGAGAVGVQQADAAQIGQVFRHIDTPTILAGIGSVALIAAVADGLFNPDNRCNPNVSGDCDTSVSN